MAINVKAPSTKILSRNKRRPAEVTREMVAPKAAVTSLLIKDLVIYTDSGVCHFKRLKYKSVPNLQSGKTEFRLDATLIDMKRDNLIRELYQLMKRDVTGSTKANFSNLALYFRWVDNNEKAIPEGDYFHIRLTDDYMEHLLALIIKGELGAGTASNRRIALSWTLKALGREQQAKNLAPIEGVKASTISYVGLHPETELIPIAKLLLKAYVVLKKHYVLGTSPNSHPFWDKELAEKVAIEKGLKVYALSNQLSAPKKVLNRVHKLNPLIEVAILISFMFTGMNLTPMSRMLISDVKFKSVQGGRYLFYAQKDRARYLELDNAMGFSKHAKEFIEGWLKISLEIANGDMSAPLFPHFLQAGEGHEMVHYTGKGRQPQQRINKLLKRMGLPTIGSSVFRKTKSDILMKVTEDVYLVSLSMNNSVEVTRASYAHGHESDHRVNLKASMDATFNIINGKPFKESVEQAKFNVSEVLDHYQYQKKREGEDRSHESRTPLGVTCLDNTKGAASAIKRAIKKVGVEVENSESLCTNFLGCWECEFAKLVADVESIWLTLSFKDTLEQMQQTPAINSMPKKDYELLWNTIVHILSLYENQSSRSYKEAKEKHKESAHPLYATAHSIEDLLDIFL